MSLKNLAAFAAKNPTRPGPVCGICQLPPSLRGEIEEGRAALLCTYRQLARYLKEAHGVEVTSERVGAHFRKGHHEAKR